MASYSGSQQVEDIRVITASTSMNLAIAPHRLSTSMSQ
jgi:hypothetical protein